jgi:hypothetical protein
MFFYSLISWQSIKKDNCKALHADFLISIAFSIWKKIFWRFYKFLDFSDRAVWKIPARIVDYKSDSIRLFGTFSCQILNIKESVLHQGAFFNLL